jgi:hypothetical protein
VPCWDASILQHMPRTTAIPSPIEVVDADAIGADLP